jgi:hypothetical protein
MERKSFETAARRTTPEQTSSTRSFTRYRPQVMVSVLVVAVLVGGAPCAALLSEVAPRVVYTASLEEVEEDAQGSLRIDLNTASVEELDEAVQRSGIIHVLAISSQYVAILAAVRSLLRPPKPRRSDQVASCGDYVMTSLRLE